MNNILETCEQKHLGVYQYNWWSYCRGDLLPMGLPLLVIIILVTRVINIFYFSVSVSPPRCSLLHFYKVLVFPSDFELGSCQYLKIIYLCNLLHSSFG